MAITTSPPAFSVKRTGSPPSTTTAPRMRAMQARDWVEGAIQNARQQRLDGTLHFVGQMGQDFVFRCFDHTGSRHEHNLILNFEQKRIHCTCWDGVNEWPCAHFGALVLLWRDMQQSALPKNISHPEPYGFWSALNAS